MKNFTKLTLVAALVLCSSTLFAQKFGYINTQDLIAAMPERDSVQIKLTAYSQELGTQLETIQVEFNNKLQELQKGTATMAESIRQLKEKELQELQGRYQEFQEIAQQDMQKMQVQLMSPIVQRAENAIKKVSKANAFTIVFDQSAGAMAYYDEAALVNVLPLVKKELGIKEAPVTPAAPAAPAKK